MYRVMGDADFYKRDISEIKNKRERVEIVKKLLADSYARWEELEQLKSEI